jgi:plasmid stabilization system protein ParE
MPEPGFVLHPQAAQDITEIWEFIAGDNLGAAQRIREEILEALRRLSMFPKQGHLREDLTSRPLRFLRVREYLIAYAPDEQPLLVVAVIHGRRSPRTIAALLRTRG